MPSGRNPPSLFQHARPSRPYSPLSQPLSLPPVLSSSLVSLFPAPCSLPPSSLVLLSLCQGRWGPNLRALRVSRLVLGVTLLFWGQAYHPVKHWGGTPAGPGANFQLRQLLVSCCDLCHILNLDMCVYKTGIVTPASESSCEAWK